MIYPFTDTRSIIATLDTGNKGGKAWSTTLGYEASPITQMTVTASTIDIKDYSNNLYSFGRVSSGQMVWILKNSQDTSSSNFRTVVITNPAGSGENVLSVTFSQNKAIFFAQSNTFSVYTMGTDGTYCH